MHSFTVTYFAYLYEMNDIWLAKQFMWTINSFYGHYFKTTQVKLPITAAAVANKMKATEWRCQSRQKLLVLIDTNIYNYIYIKYQIVQIMSLASSVQFHTIQDHIVKCSNVIGYSTEDRVALTSQFIWWNCHSFQTRCRQRRVAVCWYD